MGKKIGKASVGIGGVLFTKTQRRVLGLLFGHPERRYYGNELIKLAGVGIGAVRTFLQDLLQVGLITVTKEGSQKYYQANHEAPIFQELRSLVIKTFGVAELLKDALAPSEDRIYLAFLYGSIVKGTDHADSDIDILVIPKDISYLEVMKILVPLTEELGREIDLSLYEKEEFASKINNGNHFLETLVSQPTIMLIGTENDLKKLREHRPTEG